MAYPIHTTTIIKSATRDLEITPTSLYFDGYGSITTAAGLAITNSGSLDINSGEINLQSDPGEQISLLCDAGATIAGGVTITAGNGTVTPGAIDITAGAGVGVDGADLTLGGGSCTGTDKYGGDVIIQGGSSTGDKSSVVYIKATEGSTPGSTIRSPTTYATANGSTGYFEIAKPTACASTITVTGKLTANGEAEFNGNTHVDGYFAVNETSYFGEQANFNDLKVVNHVIDGLYILGSDGDGLAAGKGLDVTAGAGTNAYGAEFKGDGSGYGLYTIGGDTNGTGLRADGIGSGAGVYANGGTNGGFGAVIVGSASGNYAISATGGPAYAGVHSVGGAGNSNGTETEGVGAGTGLVATGGATGYGAIVQADTSTPVRSAFRIVPQDTAPSSPQEGDLYVNSTDHKLYCYLSAGWRIAATP